MPIQIGANAYLSNSLGNSILSTLVVFLVASVATLFALFLQRALLPSLAQMAPIPWYAWCTGGVFNAACIFLLIYTAPKLGMVTLMGLVVLGQILMALTVDQFGGLGFSIHLLNWKRVAGALPMVIGFAVAAEPFLSCRKEESLWPMRLPQNFKG